MIRIFKNDNNGILDNAVKLELKNYIDFIYSDADLSKVFKNKPVIIDLN